MSEKIVENFCRLQERLAADGEYMALNAEYRARGEEFLAVLEEVTTRQKDIIMDYLGVWAAIHTRMVVTACDEK